MNNIPSEFTRTTTEVHGDVGRAWLAHLPSLLTECAARWSLTIAPPFTPLTYNFAAPAVRTDGTPVVLKIGVPCQEFAAEIEALRLFDGQGSVRLLEADADKGMMLLERLTPGTSLVTVADDEQAASIAACVMRNLWRPVPETQTFPTVTDWFLSLSRLRRQFDGGTGPLPPRLVEEAEALSAGLTASATDAVLLHGDLHHGNILRAEHAGWLAIDPKGTIGEPAFEPSAFLLNNTPQSAEVLQRRVAVFAERLDVPRERVRGWGLARAVLSACWTLEDHGMEWQGAIVVAGLLAA